MTSDQISVWAPNVATVELAVGRDGDGRLPMSRRGDGWWAWEGDPREREPFDYAFVLDGAEPLPDPRSAWQPQGVDRPSRWVDTSGFAWTDDTWLGPRDGCGTTGGVIYELHIGTFTSDGTLDAAVDRLDHLVRVGVDVVELMPVAAFPGRWGWGYDGVLPYAVHDQYGGPAALARFVDAAHARGLGVALDVVHNHLGPSGNHLTRFGPYFTEAHTTPWGPAVNLDQDGSHEVRRWIIDNALRWFRDFHVDALRLDAVHELRDTSPRHILAELSDEVATLEHDLGRPLDLIAESDLNDPRMVTPTAESGLGMDAQWADDVHHALHVALTGERQGYYADFGGGTRAWPEGGPLSVLAKVLREVFLHDGRWSTFRGQEWGAPVDRARVGGHSFVAYLQTHDQVGNRAVGDRIAETIRTGPDALRGPEIDTKTPEGAQYWAPSGRLHGRQAIGAALYLLSPFTPMVFMGEEWAATTPFQFFSDFPDPELGEVVRQGRRAEFADHGWSAEDVPDPQEHATRDRSVLDWSEPGAEEHARMLDWYAAMITLRRAEPDVQDDDLRRVGVNVDETADWLVMRRGSVAVVANLAGSPQEVPLPGGAPDVLASWTGLAPAMAHGIRLEGHDVAVVRLTSP